MIEKLQRIGNGFLSLCAGISSFIFTLIAMLMLRELDEKILASITMGTFALLLVWIASERPNSGQARAVSALIKRLLAVGSGDFSSPAPAVLKKEMPALATAVETLFDQVKTNLEDVQKMAMYDSVTTLPNRLYLKNEGERMLATLPKGKQAALLFIDLDGFKEVNDGFGHAQGDHVLQLVADRLRDVVQAETDPLALMQPIIARLSGDEFTLLFPFTKGSADAYRIAREVLAALSGPFDVDGRSLRIGASIGVALWPSHANQLPGLMKAADIAMYHAKGSGRSQVCLYTEDLATAFERRNVVKLPSVDAGLLRSA